MEKLEEDAEIRLIERRKLDAMKRRLKTVAPPAKAEKSDRQVVEGFLYDRGDEVLDAAYSFYPKQTEALVRELAGMVRDGRLAERVSGGELYSIFRELGLRFRLRTSIRVQDRGRLVDLSEKLSRKEQ